MRDEECESDPFCRICLGGSDEMECGDLLTPCNCTGSSGVLELQYPSLWDSLNNVLLWEYGSSQSLSGRTIETSAFSCFWTWRPLENGPTLPEAGPIVTTVFGLLACTGYYWLCMRIRCELCGSVYRVKRVRLHWLMRWMVFLVLLSALLVTCGLFIRTGPAMLFRTAYTSQIHATDRLDFALESSHATGGMVSSDAPRFICFIPKYRRWLYCFEAADDSVKPRKIIRSWLDKPGG